MERIENKTHEKINIKFKYIITHNISLPNMTIEKRYLVDEYIELYQDLVKKQLGDKNIVLLQNGMFYEVYNYRNPDGPDLEELQNLLDCKIGRKTRDCLEVSRTNYEMIGFPMHSQEKFIMRLLNHGYVIAIYDQVQNGVKNVERKLVEIISPSTAINYCKDKDNNYLMSIYLEPHKNTRDEFYICAYSFIDVSTGENHVNETSSRHSDYQYGIEKLYQSIKLFNPHEIVCNVNTEYLNGHEWIYTHEELLNELEILTDSRTFHYYEDRLDKNIFKLSYQNNFLGSIFRNHGMLTPIEFLELEKYPNAIISYLTLLDFAKNHRTDIIEKISRPQLIDNDDTLVLTQNSMYQLNIVSDKNQITLNNKNNSLVNILNNCTTAFGKRHFKHRLLNPCVNIDTLNTNYNSIEVLKTCYEKVDSYLQKVFDVERLFRRLALKILTPNEFYNMYSSCKYIYDLLIYLRDEYPKLLTIDIIIVESFKKFIDYLESRFDIENCKLCGKVIDRSIFVRGFYHDIDKVDMEIEQYLMAFQSLAVDLSSYIDKKAGEEDKQWISVERNDRDGRYLEVTKKRWDSVRSKVKGLKLSYGKLHVNMDELDCKTSGLTSIKINGGQIQHWNTQLNERRTKIISLIGDEYPKLLGIIDSEYHTILKKITKFVANIDILKCHTVNALHMNLTRPIIDDSQEKSYLVAKGLRHPIVERINTKTAFVTNDITLGKDNIDQVICYGYNAVGKTTLQKALCIAIIMAQSGGYVACGEFTYKPYKYIFTRIGNTDNILKNQSSFMVEMAELNYILKHANKNSLVCIDELVASTERFSGISLVCASIVYLYEHECSVFMATHLHEISKISKINSLERLKIVHLEVHYDNNTQTLIYDRKLKDGSGNGLYGLEVAKYLKLSDKFMNMAFEFRNELLGNELEVYHAIQSNYNKDVFLHKCEICGYKPISDTDIPLETHHIHFQSCSNILGNFETLGFHKNVEHNLVALCRKCHTDTHNNMYQIKGYIQTGDGYKLDYHNNISISEQTETGDLSDELNNKMNAIISDLPTTQQLKTNTKKLTPEQALIAKTFLDKISQLNGKSQIRLLDTEFNIKVDYKILRRIKMGTY
jgi:DNA mismatch repair protein MutS